MESRTQTYDHLLNALERCATRLEDEFRRQNPDAARGKTWAEADAARSLVTNVRYHKQFCEVGDLYNLALGEFDLKLDASEHRTRALHDLTAEGNNSIPIVLALLSISVALDRQTAELTRQRATADNDD